VEASYVFIFTVAKLNISIFGNVGFDACEEILEVYMCVWSDFSGTPSYHPIQEEAHRSFIKINKLVFLHFNDGYQTQTTQQ